MIADLKKEVLLVDDEAGIRKVLRISLEDGGYRVHTAQDAVKALEIFKKHSPPVVMTDIKMPGMNGIDLLKALKELNQEGTTILLVEQNARLALQFAQRGYVLESGNLVLQGNSEELLANPEVKKAYLG